MASEQSIQKFRELYKKEFGIEITKEQAAKIIAQFWVGGRIIVQPMPKSWEPRYRELLEQESDSRKDLKQK
jgi:hypothetical protein